MQTTSVRPSTASRPGTAHRRPGTGSHKKKKAIGKSDFRKYYDNGEVPFRVISNKLGRRLVWKDALSTVDFDHVMPVVFEGLTDAEEFYRYSASTSISDMVKHLGPGFVALLPLVTQFLRAGISSRKPEIVASSLRVLQELTCSSPKTAEALVEHYRSLLPTLNIIMAKLSSSHGSTSGILLDNGESFGNIVAETLEALETTGGPSASKELVTLIPSFKTALQQV